MFKGSRQVQREAAAPQAGTRALAPPSLEVLCVSPQGPGDGRKCLLVESSDREVRSEAGRSAAGPGRVGINRPLGAAGAAVRVQPYWYLDE